MLWEEGQDKGRGVSYMPAQGNSNWVSRDGCSFGHTIGKITHPDETVLTMDAWNKNGWTFNFVTGAIWGANGTNMTYFSPRFRHGDEANVLYADGHVSPITFEDLPDASGTQADPDYFWGFQVYGYGY
jgi:prepilin-type processing-associated H-X9-DG protein